MAMSRLAISMASEEFDVSVTALGTPGPAGGETFPLALFPKPPLRRKLATSMVRVHRSLVHSRFDTRALREHLASTNDDRYVAEHAHMAESYLAVRDDAAERLLTNSVVFDSDVWRATRHRTIRAESRRIARDELRVYRASRGVGVFDRSEVALLDGLGTSPATWLSLTLPPRPKLKPETTGPVALFLGNREWPPNAEAVNELHRLWPAISAGITQAKLFIVGKRPRQGWRAPEHDGIEDLDFVPDLEALLAQTRCLIAPIRTGGGVRVKLLESAAMGLPVAATQEAIGSLSELLPVTPAADDDALVDHARRLLMDSTFAARAGDELHAANAERWAKRLPHQSLAEWITA
jgi:hypothetical protein